MRIGASLDLRFGQDSLEFLDFLNSNGFRHIEVRKDNDHVFGKVDPEMMKSMLSDYDFTISYHAPHREFNLASVNEDIRKCCVDQIIEMGEYLHEVGSGWVNIHIGHIASNYHEKVIEKAEKNSRKSLEEIAEAFEDLDSRLFVENDSYEKGLLKFGLYPEQLIEVLEKYPHFGMTFDIGHAHHYGIDAEQFINPAKDSIGSVHLHDNNGTFDEHLAAGNGTVDFEPVLEKLGKCCDTYIFEMKTLDDVVRSREYIESLGYGMH
ncbi:MAG: hypothetical protein PWQ63_698 [Methanolobus sp.]|nr:hypothetical protein [Methanolobus sp.]